MSRVTLFECNKCSIREDKGNCSEWHIDKNDFSLCEVCVRSISRASLGELATFETFKCITPDCTRASYIGSDYCIYCSRITKC